MASKKRENPATEDEQQPSPKKLNVSSLEHESFHVALNPADCDLAFNIEADGLTGNALYDQGFAYCWSGARGNVGITGGKYCFGCKIISDQPVTMEDTPVDKQHICRVGISRGDDLVGNLGETEHSLGYGGTGKFSKSSKFVDYGEKFGIGDTIVCLVDLESKPRASLEFSKNGKRLGVAAYFDAGNNGLGVIDSQGGKLSWESALFPHVLLKNTVIKMQFSIEDGLVPEEGYKPWNSSLKDAKAVIGPGFVDPKDCEVIMMVGLPASGKTTWAEKWVKEHPEKRYILLGTNLALDQMKVPGLLRKCNYGERFDHLMDRASGIFNKLLSRASKVSRNYIIDQTNVYKSARIRKLKPFSLYHKVAVVVFPRQEELKLRAEKRFKEMGKDVPSEAVNAMLANFVLPMSKDMPGTDEFFDEVIFTDLSRNEAQQHLGQMKHGLQLSSMEKRNNSADPPYSRESSVHSNSTISASSLPGPGSPYLGYLRPSLGLETGTNPVGSYIGPPESTFRPNTPSVNFRSEGPGYSGIIETAAESYQGSMNYMLPRDGYPGTFSRYSNCLPGMDRGDPRTYPSYREPVPGNNPTQYGTPGYRNYIADNATPDFQPPYASPYGTPNQRPQESYPAGAWHHGTGAWRPRNS
ncbi:Heterogeneous nuclear ribonucleoprotein U-like protein 1 [Bienertia sinuspersici]